jgi:mono/diheme cytochrome c family protein
VADAGGIYATPWALSDKYFLTSYSYATLPMSATDPPGYALYLIDVYGTKELIYRDPAISCSVPIPLRPRLKPPILPDTTDPSKDYAVCTINDVGYGSPEIASKVRYVRVAEPIGWPYDNTRGGQRYGEKGNTMINWTPIRILGDVPVEADGSAHFMVPPNAAVYFQLLDENRMELRRMRSFISFQRGEQRGCVGCHETRAEAPLSRVPGLASNRPPVRPIPPPWGTRPVSFLRDIQPIFDRNCVTCHSGLKPAGGLDYFGGLTTYNARIPGYGHNRAYDTLIGKRLVSFSAVHAQDATITPSMAYGAHKSKLVEVLRRAPHTERVKLTPEEWLRLTIWIDANTPYHDQFVNKRPERPVYDIAADRQLQDEIGAVHQRRCASCHKSAEISRLDWIDVRDPSKSLFLTAPLAPKPGAAKGKCGGNYKDANDPDYQAVLKLVRGAVDKLRADPRRDVMSLKESAKQCMR